MWVETIMTKTHKLSIEIEDTAFQRMRSEMGMKIAVGNSGGAPDEFIRMIIVAIDKNEKEIKIVAKKKGD